MYLSIVVAAFTFFLTLQPSTTPLQAKKAARATEESWDATTKEKVVSALVQTLEGDVCSAWDSGEPEKDWLQLFMKAAGAILEVNRHL